MQALPDALQRALRAVQGTVAQLGTPGVSVYWGYLLSALLIATAIYLLRDRRSRTKSLRDWLAYCFPRSIYGSRSFFHDVAIFVINTLLYSFLLLGPMTALSSSVASVVWQQLAELLGPRSADATHFAWRAIATIVVLVVADLAFFTSHWLQHRVSWLWEFHKVHHSAAQLEPFTVFRRHPVDVMVEGAITGCFLGLAYGALFFAAGSSIEVVEVLGTNALLFAFLLAGFNLQHSHVWWSFGPLDLVFISPATHQLHHSTEHEHLDKNFGNVLSIWDRVAGTFVRPGQPRRLHLGLLNDEHAEYDSLWRLYWLPVVKCLRRISRRRDGP